MRVGRAEQEGWKRGGPSFTSQPSSSFRIPSVRLVIALSALQCRLAHGQSPSLPLPPPHPPLIVWLTDRALSPPFPPHPSSPLSSEARRRGGSLPQQHQEVVSGALQRP